MPVMNATMKLHYHGGTAEEGLLDLYDAGNSITGMARALAITTHCYISRGEIRRRAAGIEGAKLYIYPSRRGSFEELVKVVFSAEVAAALGMVAQDPSFADFIRWAWSDAIGRPVEPQTDTVAQMSEADELLRFHLSTALEPSLADLHRPIRKDREIGMTLSYPQVGNLAELDTDTLAYVSASPTSDIVLDVLGNITKYNVITGYGRYYDDQQERTMPFCLDTRIAAAEKSLLTWSMHQRNIRNQGKLLMDVRYVMTSQGAPKRAILCHARRASILN